MRTGSMQGNPSAYSDAPIGSGVRSMTETAVQRLGVLNNRFSNLLRSARGSIPESIAQEAKNVEEPCILELNRRMGMELDWLDNALTELEKVLS